MRRLSVVMFALLAACELQPAPKQQAAPPAPAPPHVVEAPADAGVVADAPAAPVFTDQCREVGVHIAEVIINSATDPGAKSIYEQDRAKIVRSTAETCMTQGWSDVAAKCYLKARTAPDLKACETKYTPPQPRAHPEAEPQTRDGSGAGSGSAAAPRAGAGSAAAPRPGAGSAAAPRPGAGSAAAPRPAAGAGSAAPRAGAGSAAPRAGAGSAATPRSGAGSAAPRAGSGSAAR